MSEHTKGPWWLGTWTAPDDYGWRIQVEEGNMVAISARSAESEGNAMLIAAAPEMYEALRAIVDWANGPQPRNVIEDLLLRAEKVLAKATGGDK